MTITTYQVQNILRTYGKQLGRIRKAAGQTASAQSQKLSYQVEISSEAKRRQVINKIAQEIIDQITSQPQTRTSIEEEALGRLSQEVGLNLEVFRNRDGGLRFAIIDPEAKTIVADILPEGSDELAQRFSEITQSIVDQNMVS